MKITQLTTMILFCFIGANYAYHEDYEEMFDEYEIFEEDLDEIFYDETSEHESNKTVIKDNGYICEMWDSCDWWRCVQKYKCSIDPGDFNISSEEVSMSNPHNKSC